MGETRFETVDIYLAAYLYLNMFPPTLNLNQGRVVFTFPQSQSLHSLISQYNSNTSLGVLDFTAAVKIMRGLMIEAKKRPFNQS